MQPRCAQFEREVTSERIRDMIGSSKRRGLWVGGMVPLGYVSRDKKLFIEEEEAKRVRAIFQIAEAFFARHLGGACEPVGNDFDGSSHEVRAGADLLADSVRLIHSPTWPKTRRTSSFASRQTNRQSGPARGIAPIPPTGAFK
jgi:hypothetical protein